MANSKIKQILVGTTTYDIEDASAAKLASNNTFTGDNTFEGKNYFSYKTYLGTLEDNVAELSFKDDTTGYPTPEKAYIRTVIQAGAEYNGRPTIDFVNTEGGSNRDMIALTKWDKPNEHYYRTALENAVSSDPGSTSAHSAAIVHYELNSDTGAPTNYYRAKFPLKSGTVALTSDIDVTAAGNNRFTGLTNTFTNKVNLQGLVRIGSGESVTNLSSTSTTLIDVNLPSKAGTLALTDDIDVTAAGNNTFTGNNTFKYNIRVSDESSIGGVSDTYVEFDASGGVRIHGSDGTDTFKNLSDIGSGGDVTTAGNNTFTGTNTFAYNSIKINNKYHDTNSASWATTIQGWDPTGGGNNNFILTLPKTSGTITVGVKVNGTIHAADSSGLVDLGTISGGSSGPIKTATLSGTTLSITLS